MSSIAIVLSDDLIFASRIVGYSRDLDATIRTSKSMTGLLELADETAPSCVFIDLQNPGLAIDYLVARLQGLPTPPRIVAYGSHVDAATLKAARAAGCDHVMPRSQFVEELPCKIGEWLS